MLNADGKGDVVWQTNEARIIQGFARKIAVGG